MARTDDLIVTDTSPLITLALGDHLHALTAPGLRVVIPDAVWVEATRVEGAPGASELIEWIARNDDRVSVRPTETGQDQLQRLRDGRPIQGMGEAAALEVLTKTAEYHPSRSLFLIFEDKDLEKRSIILPKMAYAIATGDWLRLAEQQGLIQSADEVLDRAATRGRSIEHQRLEGSRQEAIDAARKSLAKARSREGRMGREREQDRTVEGRPDFRDLGAGLAMRRLGLSDDTIVSVLGYLPDLDIPASDIERHATEIKIRRRGVMADRKVAPTPRGDEK